MNWQEIKQVLEDEFPGSEVNREERGASAYVYNVISVSATCPDENWNGEFEMEILNGYSLFEKDYADEEGLRQAIKDGKAYVSRRLNEVLFHCGE